MLVRAAVIPHVLLTQTQVMDAWADAPQVCYAEANPNADAE